MAVIIKNRTIRPSSRLATSKSYKINTKKVANGDTLIVNINHESDSFCKTYKFNNADLAKRDSISFRVIDNGNTIDISWSGVQPVGTNKSVIKPKKSKQELPPKTFTITHTSSIDIESILEKFKANRFDPLKDSESKVADSSGNYILCLRKNAKLPFVSVIPEMTVFEGLNVIYTGIASGSLRTRDYRQHFKGNNAGRSTLRKSLGVLFGYKQIPRDKDPNNGKTKFSTQDEEKLTEWMHSNLIMFFLPTTDFISLETKLINHFNPPLNLKNNHNGINADFRRQLTNLRASKNKSTRS